jgi:hypothetical protein
MLQKPRSDHTKCHLPKDGFRTGESSRSTSRRNSVGRPPRSPGTFIAFRLIATEAAGLRVELERLATAVAP